MLDVFCYSVAGTPTVVTAQGDKRLLGAVRGDREFREYRENREFSD